MTLQNVSIVLSPTMQISHRVLYCFFEFSSSLFGGVVLKKYVPPISGPSGLLPESPEGIEEEMKKQESLLEALHKEISLGVASKATEEQLWEQQRIVTQLKRNLRHALAKASAVPEAKRPPDFDEELNFSLQVPQVCQPAEEQNSCSGKTASVGESGPESKDLTQNEKDPGANVKSGVDVGSKETTAAAVLSSPEVESAAGNGSQEHRVTVQIHQIPSAHRKRQPCPEALPAAAPDEESAGHVTVIALSQESSPAKAEDKIDSPGSELKEEKSTVLKDDSETSSTVKAALVSPPAAAALDSPADQTGTRSGGKPPNFLPLKTSTPASSTASTASVSAKPPLAGFPLLPPPPPSTKAPVRALPLHAVQPKGFNVPVEARMKSKSLPRGLPSDGSLFDKFRKKEPLSASVAAAPPPPPGDEREEQQLLLEEMRLKFEYEELLNLKSELERRKKTERREVAELQVRCVSSVSI
jgi:hypothetical protein